MKRCPECNRIETDEALKFCRVDGATLVSDSSSIGSEAGTAQLGSANTSDVHTSMFPQNTEAGTSRATGPTVLPLPTHSTTGTLSKPISRKTIVIITSVMVLFAVIAIGI